ncbi:predicted protein [Verticillium alfalfae VaMs.102]|uniref:Predicted protein n=1 Tax=Verticillium alfalfae (strain VaMs.102 / ATCC MYA-4576 / FGSC 10136) TaxID=526221 RepID=C9SAW7_VERA1|nr:predicted protein [Verticillium alfalfae VaMs.102]EEY15541.1 predicted protein [Verticillium alfalfae VaMs.102]
MPSWSLSTWRTTARPWYRRCPWPWRITSPAYEAIAEVDAATIKPAEVVQVIEVTSGVAKTKKFWATQAKTGSALSGSTTGEMLKGLYADYTPCWKKTTARVHRLARGKADLIVVGAFLALTVMLWTLQVMSGVILRYVTLSLFPFSFSFISHTLPRPFTSADTLKM